MTSNKLVQQNSSRFLNSTSTKISTALADLVAKRQQQIAYLRRTHLPDVNVTDRKHFGQKYFWLNSIEITPQVINNSQASNSRRIRAWFCLGHSMSNLLSIESGTMLVNSLIQLMEEYAHEFDSKLTAFSFLRAKNIDQKLDIQATAPIKPIIYKQNNKVVYQYLQTPVLPEGIDYCLTVYSLMSILFLVYGKFLDASCSHEIWRKAIETLDQKVSTFVLKELTDVLTKLTYAIVENEISNIIPNCFLEERNNNNNGNMVKKKNSYS